MHDDEVHTDADLVRRLIRDQFPCWAELNIEPVPSSGTDNALYRLGPDLAVRLPRIHWAVGNVDTEYRWLPRLESLLPQPIPVPLARGEAGQGFPWPWTVCRWLQGRHPAMGGAAREAELAADLAGFVTALGRVQPADGPPARRGVPLGERDQPTRAAIEQLAGLVDTDRATKAWEAALAAPPWNGPALWVHGDLSPLNILCTDDRLSGVIDFGCVGIGDPACDAIPAWNTFSPRGRRRYRDGLGFDHATWARGRGWALSVSLIQLPYYRHTNPGLCEISYYVLDQILNDDDGT